MKASIAENDLVLIEEMKAGDHSAYETLYNKYASQLYVFTANKLHSKEIAEELVHDVFIRLWEMRARLDIQSNVAGYLFKMMRNEVLQYLRGVKHPEAFIDEMLVVEIGDQGTADESIYYKEMAAYLTQIIAGLPEKCREIFVLSRDHDLSIKEIASRLNIADQTVKNQLTKALTVLRKELKHITYLFFSTLCFVLLDVMKF